MSNIRIFADNTCDLNRKILKEYNIKTLHMPVILDGQTYRDRLDIEPADFYKILANAREFPKTAQITPAEYVREFTQVIENSSDEIIYICFSSQLSGTYQAACIAREMVSPERITVVDSLSASAGYGLMVLKAAQAAKEGKNKEEILALLKHMIQHIEQIFIVGNLEMLKKGGRINPAAAAVGNLLNIKLILHLQQGKILPLEKVHGLKKAQKRLIEIVESRAGEILKDQLIGISHANDYEGAIFLKNLLENRFGCREFLITEVGAVIGAHVGAGTNAVFFLNKLN